MCRAATIDVTVERERGRVCGPMAAIVMVDAMSSKVEITASIVRDRSAGRSPPTGCFTG